MIELNLWKMFVYLEKVHTTSVQYGSTTWLDKIYIDFHKNLGTDESFL